MLTYLHINSPRWSAVVKYDDDVVVLFSLLTANLNYFFNKKTALEFFMFCLSLIIA